MKPVSHIVKAKGTDVHRVQSKICCKYTHVSVLVFDLLMRAVGLVCDIQRPSFHRLCHRDHPLYNAYQEPNRFQEVSLGNMSSKSRVELLYRMDSLIRVLILYSINTCALTR